MVARPTAIGSSPENAGSVLASRPQMTMAAVSKTNDAPTVAMIWASTPLLIRGRIATSSIPTLMTATSTTDTQEAGPERQADVVEADAQHAPQHHHLPLGEVDDACGAEHQREADGGERIDAPAGDAAEDVLEELVGGHDWRRSSGDQSTSPGPKTRKPLSDQEVFHALEFLSLHAAESRGCPGRDTRCPGLIPRSGGRTRPACRARSGRTMRTTGCSTTT